ncbi:hypothetical protein [Blastopirellula retiformator]|uniref:DUF4376 domain-containing protein n=1 Tax=Blastopirellula retiformator TaxID=2527970 RepID=A0A5C5UWH0_9BACT|nr:hypothetical protein [Blastopirellula retiformator]TWT30724.1 hypothetical protein Enr8_42470 [Blastopirellula retiformator]
MNKTISNSRGIAKVADGIATEWATLHERNHCNQFFGNNVVADPLPDGYLFADSLDEAQQLLDAANDTNHAAIATKLTEINDAYDQRLNAGFPVVVGETDYGFSLRIDKDARNEFDALLTGINTQLLLGIPASSITETIYGIDEDSPDGLDDGHQVTAIEFVAIFSAGKAYYQSLLKARKSYQQQARSGDVDFTPWGEQ